MLGFFNLFKNVKYEIHSNKNKISFKITAENDINKNHANNIFFKKNITYIQQT